MKRAPKRPPAMALRLLVEARKAIFDELHAAGADEVKIHPAYRAHQRTHARITRYLNRYGVA